MLPHLLMFQFTVGRRKSWRGARRITSRIRGQLGLVGKFIEKSEKKLGPRDPKGTESNGAFLGLRMGQILEGS